MKDQATHIRLIRDENGTPVEAEYERNTPFEAMNNLVYLKWAEANRIPVTGDWPTDKNVFAMDEVEPVDELIVGKTMEPSKTVTKLRLKAKQEEQPKQEAKTAEEVGTITLDALLEESEKVGLQFNEWNNVFEIESLIHFHNKNNDARLAEIHKWSILSNRYILIDRGLQAKQEEQPKQN